MEAETASTGDRLGDVLAAPNSPRYAHAHVRATLGAGAAGPGRTAASPRNETECDWDTAAPALATAEGARDCVSPVGGRMPGFGGAARSAGAGRCAQTECQDRRRGCRRRERTRRRECTPRQRP